MGDIVVSPLIHNFSVRLSSVTASHETQMKMRICVAQLETLAVEAENLAEGNEALKCWLIEVKDVIYDADDLLDDVIGSKVNTFFSTGRKLKSIQARFDELLNSRIKFGCIRVNPPSFKHNDVLDPRTSYVPSDSEIIGRDQDKGVIINELLSFEQQFPIIPIVGMGGVGKTTLAQSVYNDQRIRRYYGVRIWISLANAAKKFDVAKVRRYIMKSLLSPRLLGSRYISDMDAFAKLNMAIKERAVLIVLDDVWGITIPEWELTKRWLTLGSRSGVIVTTRSENVALRMGTTSPFILNPLCYEDSWSLFRLLTSSSKEEGADLARIGINLLSKCSGLPLAVKVLSYLLQSNREESKRLLLEDSDIKNFKAFKLCVLPTLMLSYDCLPSHLKQCFAYFSVFPRNYRIKKERLIRLWIAEGFVHSHEPTERLEDIAISSRVDAVILE